MSGYEPSSKFYSPLVMSKFSLIKQNLILSLEKENLTYCPYSDRPEDLTCCFQHSYKPGDPACCFSQSFRTLNSEKLNFSEKLDFSDCKQKLNTVIVGQTSCTTGSGPKFHIKLHFSCHPVCEVMSPTLDSDELQYQRIGNGPEINTSMDFNLQQLLRKKKAFKTIEEQIKDWPVWPRGRRQLIEFFWTKARDAVKCVLAHHDTIDLWFHTIVRHRHIYEDVSGDCSICLEEFLKLSRVRRLPCSHQFHRDCISKWVRRRRNCPLCRVAL